MKGENDGQTRMTEIVDRVEIDGKGALTLEHFLFDGYPEYVIGFVGNDGKYECLRLVHSEDSARETFAYYRCKLEEEALASNREKRDAKTLASMEFDNGLIVRLDKGINYEEHALRLIQGDREIHVSGEFKTSEAYVAFGKLTSVLLEIV